MADRTSFHEFMRRIRAGDSAAAAELVRQYEPVIRFEVRLRMTDPRLCRLFDSLDVCQSVLASFFLRAANGQYDLDSPAQLKRLLVRMARNKVASQARRQQARPADRQRVEAGDLEQVVARESGLSQLVADRDFLQQVQQRLNADERQVVHLRGQGRAWPEIAAQLGGTAEGRRKQLTRALDRVARELGLEGDGREY